MSSISRGITRGGEAVEVFVDRQKIDVGGENRLHAHDPVRRFLGGGVGRNLILVPSTSPAATGRRSCRASPNLSERWTVRWFSQNRRMMKPMSVEVDLFLADAGIVHAGQLLKVFILQHAFVGQVDRQRSTRPPRIDRGLDVHLKTAGGGKPSILPV